METYSKKPTTKFATMIYTRKNSNVINCKK